MYPDAEVAQLVERRLPKPKVAGSKPVFRSTVILMMNFKATLMFLAGVLLLSSCERTVIPESRFIDIYHDILLADYYVGSSTSLVQASDSLVVYQGIIESHGFSVSRFQNAFNFYVAHPERFARMMKTLQKRLVSEGRELAELEELQPASDSLRVDSLPRKHRIFHQSEDD